MRETRTSGSMSGVRKRSESSPPRRTSTLLFRRGVCGAGGTGQNRAGPAKAVVRGVLGLGGADTGRGGGRGGFVLAGGKEGTFGDRDVAGRRGTLRDLGYATVGRGGVSARCVDSVVQSDES